MLDVLFLSSKAEYLRESSSNGNNYQKMTLETHGTGKILILQLMSHFMAKLSEFVTVMNGQRYRVMYHAVKCQSGWLNQWPVQSGKFVLCDRDLGRAVLMLPIYFIVNFPYLGRAICKLSSQGASYL